MNEQHQEPIADAGRTHTAVTARPAARQQRQQREHAQLHHIKNRLAVIKGYVQMLERELDRPQPRPDRIPNYLNRITDELERALAAVTTLERDAAGTPQRGTERMPNRKPGD